MCIFIRGFQYKSILFRSQNQSSSTPVMVNYSTITVLRGSVVSVCFYKISDGILTVASSLSDYPEEAVLGEETEERTEEDDEEALITQIEDTPGEGLNSSNDTSCNSNLPELVSYTSHSPGGSEGNGHGDETPLADMLNSNRFS